MSSNFLQSSNSYLDNLNKREQYKPYGVTSNGFLSNSNSNTNANTSSFQNPSYSTYYTPTNIIGGVYHGNTGLLCG